MPNESDKNESKYATPALEKGLDVLELMAREPSGLTKSQVARQLNRTVSEIFRMLVCLEQRGYIAQVEEDRYTLTLKLFKMVQEHPPTERLVTEAHAVMQRVAHDALQSCHLGVLERCRVAILAQVNAPANVGLYVRVGSTVDIMDAASGYVILAHQTEAKRESILEEWHRETGKRAPRDLQEHLKRIRKEGYEKRASYQVKGVINISFPVFDQRGAALGAITMPCIEYAESELPMKRMVAMMRDAAEEITAKIGGVLPA